MGKGSTSRRRRERNPDKAWKKVQCLKELKKQRALGHKQGYVEWIVTGAEMKTRKRKLTFYDLDTGKRDDEMVDKIFDNLITITEILFNDPEKDKVIKRGYKTGDLIAAFLLDSYWMKVDTLT